MKQLFYLLSAITCILFNGIQVIAQNGTWKFQYPSKFQNNMSDAQILDYQNIYMVGNKGNFLVTNNGGVDWQLKKLPTQSDLYTLHFVDKQTGWAASKLGEIFHTSDAGSTWTKQFNDVSTRTLRHIHLKNKQLGCAVGDNGYVNNVLFSTKDGGHTWTEATNLPYKEGAAFAGMFYCKTIGLDTIYAISWDNMFYKTQNGGVSWDTVHIATGSTTDYFEGGFFLDDKNGWVVGPNQSIVHTSDAGQSWELQLGNRDSTDENNNYFSEVTFIDKNLGYASAFGNLYKTTDGGKQWVGLGDVIGTGRKIYVGFANAENGFASDGTNLYHTTDGESWNNLNTNSREQINAGIVLSDKKLLAVASSGSVFTTTNAGLSWQNAPSRTTKGLRGVTLSANQLISVGNAGTILLSKDEGKNWSVQNSMTTKNLYAVSAYKSGSTVLAVGDSGTVLRSSDAGENWSVVSSGKTFGLRGVAMVSPTVVYAVGTNGTILKSTDLGDSWQTQTISGFVRTINDITFVSADTGWIACARGIVYKTTDGGVNWTSQVTGTTANLNCIVFLDKNRGYISGYNFLAHTTDGGQNWQQETNHPFGGGIADVVFGDADNVWSFGSSVHIGKYESYSITSLENEIAHKSTFLLFPNPTSGLVNVKTNSEFELRITNLHGGVILDVQQNTPIVQLPSNTEAGIYIYQLNDQNGSSMGKLIVQ
jgi:photosystem II stability/assembly factor-like uncharacterized protein